MPCPRCGFDRHDGVECPRCGIIFSRWRGARAPAVAAGASPGDGTAGEPADVAGGRAATPDEAARRPWFLEDAAAPARLAPAAPPAAGDPPAPTSLPADGSARIVSLEDGSRSIDAGGWRCFAGGAVAALFLLAFPLGKAALGALVTLIHEIGHAATGWLFGYPSLPAFDFRYGGGVTLWQGRSWLVLAMLAAGGAWGVVALRGHPALRRAAAVLLAAWAGIAATRAHDAVMIAMGHGAELAFATLFLFRALTGRSLQTPLERPLYALCGWFIVLYDVRFAWGLATSHFEREVYAAAKGGGHWMDFSRLSREFLHVPLEAVAVGFLLLCAGPPIVAVWLARRARSLG